MEEHPADRELFAARLSPHRSLSPAGVRVLLILFAAVSAAVSVPFFLMGAWPVVGFFGLDVAALWLALKLNADAARAYEEIRLSALQLDLAQVSAHGLRREWRFAPLFTRLERREDEEFGVLRLDVASRGQRVEIARCLGPAEKADFAHALGGALAEARRGPRYS
ncbi:MAG: DUF2244 domain-containing protein [Methylobacteriaceae bacterium]|nr:DUF2244 domain-containing protein [Methylobacteriaceae bacterium]